jgi:hypothetical protein
MAPRYLAPNKRATASTMASPVLSSTTELPEDSNIIDELEFFRMDGSEPVKEDNHVDTLEFLEVDVDEAQVRQRSASCRKVLTVW